MTDTETVRATNGAFPDDQMAALQARYPRVRQPILAALSILLQKPAVELDDAKAQAAEWGVRITAASVRAARVLLERMEPTAPAPVPSRKATAAPSAKRGRAPTRVQQPASDVEAMIRQIVDEAGAEATRLRDTVRRAISALQAAVEE